MKCISILRSLTDHLEDLTLSVTTRLVVTFDVPVILVNLLQEKPWIKKRKGKLDQVLDGSDWQVNIS